jgi:hypothetical protein
MACKRGNGRREECDNVLVDQAALKGTWAGLRDARGSGHRESPVLEDGRT